LRFVTVISNDINKNVAKCFTSYVTMLYGPLVSAVLRLLKL